MYSWISLSSGAGHTLAVRTDNTLWVWGSNTVGQLGDGTTLNKSSPTQVGSSNWSKVFAGASHTAAITTTGSLYVWGTNASGELGLSDTINRSSPTQVGIGSWTIASLSKTAPGFTLAISNSGALWAWGKNQWGAVGDNTTIDRSSPVQIGSSSWTVISAGVSNAGAIDTLGKLWTWGYSGSSYALGHGNTIHYSYPVEVTTGASWTNVAMGGVYNATDTVTYGFGAAIRSDGLLFTWGSNRMGQLGYSSTYTYVSVPSALTTGQYSWTQVAIAGNTMFGISSNTGQLLGWGQSESGQLGFNGVTTVNRSSPVLVDSGGSFTLIAAGAASSTVAGTGTNTALFYNKLINGLPTLYGIGDAAVGHLGDSTTVNKSSPVQLGTNLFSNNKLIPNDSIISPFTVYESSPVQIGSGSWSIVEAGDQHTVGITSSNTLFAWGNNKFGQVGDSTTINRSSPVQIGSGTYSDASAGFNNNAVEKSDGTVYTFGSNDFGKLGDNT
jgi:alpha-tubulin suppressor-like RCC1 family protein